MPVGQAVVVEQVPVKLFCAHCARWLLVWMSWNGRRNAGQLTSWPAATAAGSRRIAAIQIWVRLQLLVWVKFGKPAGLSPG